MESTDWQRQMKNAFDAGDRKKAIELLNEAMSECGNDFSKLTNKWKHDFPVLIAVMRMALPQIEAWAGPHEVKQADQLGRISGMIGIVTPDK